MLAQEVITYIQLLLHPEENHRCMFEENCKINISVLHKNIVGAPLNCFLEVILENTSKQGVPCKMVLVVNFFNIFFSALLLLYVT